MDVSVERAMKSVVGECSIHQRPHSEQDRSLESQGNVQEGQRIMIIELGKYNKIRELFIEIEPQGCRDTYAIRMEARRVSVTKVAV